MRSRTLRDQLGEHPVLLSFAAAYLIGWTVYGFAVGADATLAYLISVVIVIALVMLLD